MFLILVSLAFIIIVAIFTFKTARENGYNALLWTAISVVSFFAAPFVVGFLFAVTLTIILGPEGMMATLERFVFLGAIITYVPGFVVSILILRRVSKLRDDSPLVEAPPPPGRLGL